MAVGEITRPLGFEDPNTLRHGEVLVPLAVDGREVSMPSGLLFDR